MKTMEEFKNKQLVRISNEILPALKSKYSIENNKTVKNIKFIENTSKSGEEQFQSIAIFGDIVYDLEQDEAQSDVKEETSLVNTVIIKTQLGDQCSLNWSNGGVQFINEILFYNTFIPYFKTHVTDIDETFPKYIYGDMSDTVNRLNDIIILEDLSKYGYRLATSRTFLSLEHILIALKHLGKFHACSYIMKSKDNETFTKKINEIKNVRNWIDDKNDFFQKFISKNGERGIKYVETLPEYKDKLTHIKSFYDNFSEGMLQIFEINEKTSVLCHGDFCRNNMFFKYNDKTEEPISVKFFDMANIILSSPVLDIAFFLYLNTSQDLRTKHWDTIIETYYESIVDTTSKFQGIIIPTFDDIKNEFKIRSLMAYFSCAFFLPVMMQEHREERSTWGLLSDDELIEKRLITGGDEATKAVGEILVNMIDNGFI